MGGTAPRGGGRQIYPGFGYDSDGCDRSYLRLGLVEGPLYMRYSDALATGEEVKIAFHICHFMNDSTENTFAGARKVMS